MGVSGVCVTVICGGQCVHHACLTKGCKVCQWPGNVCVLRMCTTSVYAFIIIYMHAVCVHVHVCVLVYCACISQCVFTSWENHLWDGFPSYDTPRTRSNRGTIGWALSQALSKTVQHAKFVRGAGNNTHQELDTFKCP